MHTDPKVKRFKISDLEFASYNPRMMDDDARKGLAESIERFGLLEMPVVNTHGGKRRVVGGHQRLRELIDAGFERVDCVVVRFDETAEMAANLSLNNTAIRGMYDPATIGAHLDSLKGSLPKPNFAAFDAAAKELREQAARLRAQADPKARDEVEAPEGEEIASKPGKVYGLGDHRVFCGDFEDGIERLTPQHYVHAVITDPPYNVAYTGGKHFRKDQLREPIEGDEQSEEDWYAFVDRLAASLIGACSGPIYVFFAAKELPALQAAWTRHKGVVHRWLVVAKSAHPLSPGDYHPQYELCMLGARRDGEIREPAELRTNLIESERPTRNGLHPAQKPVELIQRLMADTTDVGEIVLDPFAGSGTTLMVAQDLARICYACEVEPAYVDVIRKRWAVQVHGEKCDWRALTPAVKK